MAPISIKVMLVILTFETLTGDPGSGRVTRTPIPLLLIPRSALCIVKPSNVTFEAVTLNATEVLRIVIFGLLIQL